MNYSIDFGTRILTIPVASWIGVAVAFVAVRVIFKFMIPRSLFGTETSIETRKLLRRAAVFLCMSSVATVLLDETQMTPGNLQFHQRVFSFLGVLGAMYLFLGLWGIVAGRIAHKKSGYGDRTEKLLVPVASNLVHFLVVCAAILASLGVFGVNVSALIAGLGIGGLVVALAAKDSVENVFGSMTILFDMPFALGDWVKIDKIDGVVEEINLRSTRIRTFDDTLITLPNSNLIKASVENYGARRQRRLKFTVRVGHGTPIDKVRSFMAAVDLMLQNEEKVDATKITVKANDYEDAGMGVLIQCFFEVNSAADEAVVKSAVLLGVEELRQKFELDAPAVDPAPVV